MKKIKLNKISIILLIFAILVIILLMINALTGNKVISGMYYLITGKQLEETGTTIECMVYNNSNYYNYYHEYNNNYTGNKIAKTLLSITNDYGIEYIIKPDNSKINGSGKTKVFLDYSFVIDEENTFTVKAIGKEPEEKKITITFETISDQFEVPDYTSEEEAIEYSLKNEEMDKVFFKYEDGNWWREYQNKDQLGMFYYEMPTTVGNETINSKKLYFYKTDKNQNIVYFDKTVYTKSKPVGELKEGDCIIYNGRKYIVLYQYKDHATTYTTEKGYEEDYGANGPQILLDESIYSDDLMTLRSTTYSIAIQQYNSVVQDLNNRAGSYVKPGDTGVLYRSVGTNPLNPYKRG